MTIVINSINDNPMEGEILATDLVAGCFSVPVTERDKDACCSCSFVCGCDYTEYAFAGDTDYKSDRTQRFFSKVLNSDTVVIQLWKGSKKITDITDNTYGTYYNNVGINQKYDGVEIEWKRVFDLHGGGIYQIKFEAQIAGIEIKRETHNFLVMEFNPCIAAETVRIEAVIDSNLQGIFNYDGMNQRLWVRVKAKLFGKQFSIEDEEYVDGSRNLVDYQTKTPTSHDLLVKDCPGALRDLILFEIMVAEDLRVSDYSLPFIESIVSMPFKRDEYSEIDYTENGSKANFTIKLKNRKDLPIGRIQ